MATKRVFNRDIALFIVANGFEAAMAKFELKPPRARDVVRVMQHIGIEPPDDLLALASKTRGHGHRMPPPRAGDEREYYATKRQRVSVSGTVIGIDPNGPARVKYESDRIVITNPKRRRR